MKDEVKALIMLEILGRPAEHIKKVLSEIVEKLEKEKNVKIYEKKIAEPKPVPEQENLFTSFAEIELETPLEMLISICFGYMPSHVEIVYPEDLKIKNSDFNVLLNELMRRLHQYDELAKGMMVEREIIAKKIKEAEKEEKPDKDNKKKSKKKKN